MFLPGSVDGPQVECGQRRKNADRGCCAADHDPRIEVGKNYKSPFAVSVVLRPTQIDRYEGLPNRVGLGSPTYRLTRVAKCDLSLLARHFGFDGLHHLAGAILGHERPREVVLVFEAFDGLGGDSVVQLARPGQRLSDLVPTAAILAQRRRIVGVEILLTVFAPFRVVGHQVQKLDVARRPGAFVLDQSAVENPFPRRRNLQQGWFGRPFGTLLDVSSREPINRSST